MQLIPYATKTAILQPYIGVGKGLIPSSEAHYTRLGNAKHCPRWLIEVVKWGEIYTSACMYTSEPRLIMDCMLVTPFFSKFSMFLFKSKLLEYKKAPSS
jgi:hypothetical protein